MTINNKREMWIARGCILATLLSFSCLFQLLFHRAHDAYLLHQTHTVVEIGLFAASMFFMAYGSLLYQVCFAAAHKRKSMHLAASRAEIESLYADVAPSLSILVPSYKEERVVVWQTLLSAALSEYPQKDVVLLIDDPYRPTAAADLRMLEETRRVPVQLQEQFGEQHVRYVRELEAFESRMQAGRVHAGVELNRLSILYDEAADWMDTLADEFMAGRSLAQLTHIDRFFVEKVIGDPADAHRERARELRSEMRTGAIGIEQVRLQYRRLSCLFNIRFSSFERKKYANLSHEANKAMNLNSYIELIGKSWKEAESENGLYLLPCSPEDADFSIAPSDYVNTIDADTVMLSDYCLRLVHKMQQPGNERIAVIQSPCSAFPNCPGALERTASATIDIGFNTHQGYTLWNATFWVGANAMLRFTALKDIREVVQENGHPVAVYIQDRTVIEDTESSVDLVHRGWSLYNYPERMTFSPTPPDFGSLLIQRRRWANGHLLILPKLLHYVLRAPKNASLLREFFMRFYYMISPAIGCMVPVLFYVYSFSGAVSTWWVPLSGLPFLLLYIRDLRQSGYKATDMLRLTALSMMLLPIVIGGVLKSLQQVMTGKKIPFGRTPKVPGRTAAPALYSLVEVAFACYYLQVTGMDMVHHQWTDAVIPFVNSALMVYVLVSFIGIKAASEDILTGAKDAIKVLAGERRFAALRRIPVLVVKLLAGGEASAS